MKARVTVVNNQDEIIDSKSPAELTDKDIYRVAALWITNSTGEVLLAQRAFSKAHDPGKWGPAAAGTVEEGETYESNIIKEAKEEIGLRLIKPQAVHKQRIEGTHNFFCQWYHFVVDEPASAFTLQTDEVVAVKWFRRDELAKAIHEHPEAFLAGMTKLLEVMP